VLVDMVNGLVNERIPTNEPIRETPHFVILGDDKQGEPGQKRFFIEPKDVDAVAVLGQAAIQHRSINFEFIHKNGKTVMRLRADRSAHNLRVLLGGFLDVPDYSVEGDDTIPSPDKMEECIRQKKKNYTLKKI